MMDYSAAGARNLVSIAIATRNRSSDLRKTLLELRKQSYRCLEMIIIDDASDESLEPIVKELWPEARFVRRDINVGQCQCRTDAFGMARGTYVLQLDDDSHLTGCDDISRLVDLMESRPEIGVVALRIFNGQVLPAERLPDQTARYAPSFVGCGVFFRAQALSQVGGYSEFFQNEWEEEELGVKVMKAGWGIFFWPEIVVHHRLSLANRRTARTWMRGFRNRLWAIAMHWPFPRAWVEASWVITLACWDAVRLFRPQWLIRGFVQFALGLPRAISLRAPMNDLTLRRYDALRFRSVQNVDDWKKPPRCTVTDIWHWFSGSWWNRPRQRSVWDTRAGDVGTSETVQFQHEFANTHKKSGR